MVRLYIVDQTVLSSKRSQGCTIFLPHTEGKVLTKQCACLLCKNTLNKSMWRALKI